MSMGFPSWNANSRALFLDRREAGRALASKLQAYKGQPNVVVLALPRGGVPVGHEVADALGVPLDVFVVRKLGMPGHAEFAIGAIASGGVRVLSKEAIEWYRVPEDAIEAVARRELAELERREQLYRPGLPPLDLHARIVILVDDGLATGATMRAAVQAVRTRQPSRVVVAAPVGARESCADLRSVADEVVCAETPEPFWAVGQWYRDFSQTTDDEVRALLARHASPMRDGRTTP
jgi:predicted phosphoribosyltransferase